MPAPGASRQPPSHAGFEMPGGQVGEALAALSQVTAELAAASTIEAVIDAAVTHAAQALNAAVAALLLADGDQLRLAGAQGLAAEASAQWSVFDLAAATPASAAARSGELVAVATAAELLDRYPDLAGSTVPDRSTLCLPLGAPPDNVGVLAMAFDDRWLPGPGELAFLRPFADACAQALCRVDAAERAALRERHLSFLADASFALGASLDYRTTLTRVAELTVPDLADWCSVQVVEDGRLVTLAVAHVDRDKVAWAWELQKRFPPAQDSPTGAPAVARSGVAEIYPDISDDMLIAGARDEEELQLLRELAMRSVIVVPLTARGRTLGVISLIRAGQQARRYGREDLRLAEDLGRRAGLAIDNAQLHSETRTVALALQLAVLPELPTAPAGWNLAAHYEAGGRAEVGGDFFDALELPDGRLVVVVGDVMGHGIDAAAAMAQIRAAIRAFATINPDPVAVVDRLQIMFDQLAMTRLVSMSYALADRARAVVTMVNVGAMPPVLLVPGAHPSLVSVPVHPMLGADPEPARPIDVAMVEGATLLLYTDGLVERRGEALDAGWARLVRHARTLTGARLNDGVRALAAQMYDDDGHDDVTVLALRCT